ncbi:FAD-dependent monooxygenase [Streptomyces chrestomyceticus]|uniref:FAD-dependent monooxygenase n=1 Tax=Streptomyces chrestomyceticus TaxID=68185 RepID=UPI0037A01485
MHDVTIVGAGPVGLFLACELGLAGCSVLVLERDPEPRSPWKAAPLGMRGLSAASAEAFYRRGMLPSLLKTAGEYGASGAGPGPDRATNPGTASAEDEPSPPRGVGHFAGMVLDPAKVDLTALPFRFPGPAADGVLTDLEAVEAVLSERAARLGVEIRRGVTVSAVAQDDEKAVAYADGLAYAARWLVGCDGGRSAVRGPAGFTFAGTEPLFTGYVMLATVTGPDELAPGINLTPTGMYLRMPAQGYLGMMDFDGGAFDRSQRPSLDHLQTVLRRVSGTGVTLSDVRRVSHFTDRAMQTTTYRHGRVLLAGDAAHIHSPVGGQGLNLGLGDAMNLGWKLAATVHGYAPEGLLDTYTRERHPIGAGVLDWTRAQAAVMRPVPHGQAIQSVMRDLLGTRDGTTHVFEKVSGSSIRYDLGDGHPLTGRSAPDLQLEDGRRLGELLRDGRGLALDLTADRRLPDVATSRPDRLRHTAGTAKNDLGLGAVLVRPDGFVAWAGGRDFDPRTFGRAADQWFGASAS